jgi:hypothetical protein
VFGDWDGNGADSPGTVEYWHHPFVWGLGITNTGDSAQFSFSFGSDVF